MEPEKGKNRMQEAMEKVPPASQLEIVKTAHKHRIDENEPAWVLVELAMDAVGGVEKIAQALRDSSATVTQATVDQVKERRDWAKTEIDKMAEKAKSDISSALAGTLEKEIREAVARLSMKTTAKKWLSIGLLAGVAVSLATVTAGGWEIYQKAKVMGYASGVAVGGNFRHFIDCDLPGWTLEQKKDGSTWCYPTATKEGTYGWRIR